MSAQSEQEAAAAGRGRAPLLGRLSARLRGAPPAPETALVRELALGLLRPILGADAFHNLVINVNHFRGHDWYLLDRAYTVLRHKLAGSPDWRYGPDCIRTRARRAFERILPLTDIRGKTYAEIGCGAHHPLGTSAVAYLNGVASTLALDVTPIDLPERAAEALYDLLVECLALPDDWHWSAIGRAEFLDRARRFDLKALRAGRLAEGLAGTEVRHTAADLYACELKPGSVDVMLSWAVLEHFPDPARAVRALYDLTAPGGVAVHSVDLTDHRALVSPDRYHRWSFLAEAEHWSDGLCNRVRCGEFLELFRAAGFEVVATEPQRDALPEGFRAQLKGRFARMPDDELSVFAFDCVLRKP